MKKIILFVLCLFFVVGCSKNTKKDVTNSIMKKYSKSDGYMLNGVLEINNNDDVYYYDVEVGYKKKDFYKVVLTNKSNNYTQIILKNNDGVYVLTPSLNKSFRFNSDWPYNNSQIYLYDAIISDIKNDSNSTFIEKKGSYIYNTIVKYPNNNKLKNQKIVFNSDLIINKVSVFDSDGIECMKMTFKNIKFSPKFDSDYFDIDKIVDSEESIIDDDKATTTTSSIEDVVYPLFIPSGTKLASEDRVSKNSGERVIMSYEGDKSFLLVEETIDVFDDFTILPSSGEPYQLMDTIGVMTDNSLYWSSGNMEYYLVSDVMNKNELIDVAQSIIGVISMK